LGDFSPYSPVFGPRIAPLRRPDPLVHRITGTETGIPARGDPPSPGMCAGLGALRLRVRSPADLSHGAGPLGVEMWPAWSLCAYSAEAGGQASRFRHTATRRRAAITASRLPWHVIPASAVIPSAPRTGGDPNHPGDAPFPASFETPGRHRRCFRTRAWCPRR
jgi:hypothetical protein